jgi:hypothetical protein
VADQRRERLTDQPLRIAIQAVGGVSLGAAGGVGDFLARLAAGFLAAAFFGAAFLAGDFFAADFLAADFFGAAFLAGDFFAAVFFAAPFFAATFFTAFLGAVFFAAVFLAGFLAAAFAMVPSPSWVATVRFEKRFHQLCATKVNFVFATRKSINVSTCVSRPPSSNKVAKRGHSERLEKRAFPGAACFLPPPGRHRGSPQPERARFDEFPMSPVFQGVSKDRSAT